VTSALSGIAQAFGSEGKPGGALAGVDPDVAERNGRGVGAAG
jgi:hypothetical protein